MSDVLLFVISYFAVLFLNRFINILYKEKFDGEIISLFWFLHLFGTFMLLIGIICYIEENWDKIKKNSGFKTLNRVIDWFFYTKNEETNV